MSVSEHDTIRERIDKGPLSPMVFLIIAIGFMLNLVDGFDVVAMSVAGPSISEDWGINNSQKGWILSSALIGMAIGAAFLAPLADTMGRRPLVLMATAIIGGSMVVTGYIPQSVPLLMAVRLISGLGIGIVFASGATIASEFSPERYRNIAVTTVVMGYPFGAMIVGPVANFIIPRQGWEMLFVYGGVLTLALGFVLYFILPESIEFLAAKGKKPNKDLKTINDTLIRLRREPIADLPPTRSEEASNANVGSLLKGGLIFDTIGLWSVYFLGFLTLYFLLSWTPSLFVDSGFTRAQGIFALTLNNAGAVAGILLIGLITTQIRLAKPIALFYVCAAVLMAAFYFMRPTDLLTLNLLCFAIGLLLQGAFTAMYALAARVYPTEIRATGIGWAAGLGRTGAILSPIFAGYLTGLGWDLYSLSLLFAVPLIGAAVLVLRFRH